MHHFLTSLFHTAPKKRCLLGLSLLLCALIVASPINLPGGLRHATVLTAQGAEDPGLWYIDEFGIAKAHEEGIDGTGIKVADIDTMLNPNLPWLTEANLVIREKNITAYYGDVSPVTEDFDKGYHATDMISLLQGNGQGATNGNAPLGIIPGATIYHYGAVHSDDDSVTGGDIYDEAVKLALEDEVDLIIIPAGGLSYYDKQYPYLLEAIRRGIPVLISHANDRVRIDEEVHPEYYLDADGNELPADSLPTADADDEICYWPGLVTVQCLTAKRNLQIVSNVEDTGTDLAAPGENIWMQFYEWGNFEAAGGGCSAATTVAGAYLALAMQKWPEATGNQILQLLVLTAADGMELRGVDDATALITLARDARMGFGIINPEKMLETDPSALPDVNPILYIDIYRSVKNATDRGETSALTDNKNLMEIAEILEEQLVNAGIDRPEFLVTLLGEREVAQAEEETADTSSYTAEENGLVTASASLPEGPLSNKKASSFPITLILCAALGVGFLLVITVIIMHRKKKTNDSSDHDHQT